jgi:hypothetical protein
MGFATNDHLRHFFKFLPFGFLFIPFIFISIWKGQGLIKVEYVNQIRFFDRNYRHLYLIIQD